MKIAAVCLCWVLILTAPGVMAQQANASNQSWDALRQLQGGEKLEVERKTVKKKISGRFVSLSDADLIIARKGKGEKFMRDEVKNIWRVAPPGRAKQALGAICIGAGIVFGISVAVGIGASNQCGGSCADEGIAIVAVLIGIPAAGFLADRALINGKRALIYSSP
jgi:hypothetical protein